MVVLLLGAHCQMWPKDANFVTLLVEIEQRMSFIPQIAVTPCVTLHIHESSMLRDSAAVPVSGPAQSINPFCQDPTVRIKDQPAVLLVIVP